MIDHQHNDECWEPDSGCDMGRSEQHVTRSSLLDEARLFVAEKQVGHSLVSQLIARIERPVADKKPRPFEEMYYLANKRLSAFGAAPVCETDIQGSRP